MEAGPESQSQGLARPEIQTLFFTSAPSPTERRLFGDSAVAQSTVTVVWGQGASRRDIRNTAHVLRYVLTPCPGEDGGEGGNGAAVFTEPESASPGVSGWPLCVTYGTDLSRRPSTDWLDLARALRHGGARAVARAERGRRLCCRPRGSPELARRALLRATGLSESALLFGPAPKERAELASGESAEEQTRDLTSASFMEPIDAQLPSVAVQASFGTDYSIRRYLVSASPVGEATGDDGDREEDAEEEDAGAVGDAAVTHAHASTHPAHEQLESLRFHMSLFPWGDARATTVGCYCTEPSAAEGASDMGAEDQTTHATRAQIEAVAGCGAPVLQGFIRAFSAPPSGRTVAPRPLMHVTSLLTCPEASLSWARAQPGQAVVCLGAFEPRALVDRPPYVYRDSAFDLNCVGATLRLFARLAPAARTSAHDRALGCGTVEDNLLSLWPRGGVRLSASALPQSVLSRLPPRGTPGAASDLRREVNEGYLHVRTGQLFLVVPDREYFAEGWPGGSATALELLLDAARRCGCEAAVIGETCRDAGVHLIDDRGAPAANKDPEIAFTARGDDGRSEGDTPATPAATRAAPQQKEPVQETRDRRRPEVEMGAGETGDRGTADDDSENFIDWTFYPLGDAIDRVLSHPTVGSKEFWVRQTDRCGAAGRTLQQPGVGPDDVPVADYALVLEGQPSSPPARPREHQARELSREEARAWLLNPGPCFFARETEEIGNAREDEKRLRCRVMATGEQGFKGLLSAEAGARYGLFEVLTNMMFGPPVKLESVRISAAAVWGGGREALAALREAAFTCKETARELGVQLSFTSARDPHHEGVMHGRALAALTFTGHAPTAAGPRVTPELRASGNTLAHVCCSRELLLAGSVFEHALTGVRGRAPEIPASRVSALFYLCQRLVAEGLAHSGHDVSDGGLIATCLEMAVASGRGVSLRVPEFLSPGPVLFSETPGAVVELRSEDTERALSLCEEYGCHFYPLGSVGERGPSQPVTVTQGATTLYRRTVSQVAGAWRAASDAAFARHAPGASREHMELHRGDYGSTPADLGALAGACLKWKLALLRAPQLTPVVACLLFPGCPEPGGMASAFSEAGFEVALLHAAELRASGPAALSRAHGLSVSGSPGGGNQSYARARALVYGALRDPITLQALLSFFSRRDTFSLCCGELGVELLLSLKVIGCDANFDETPLNMSPLHNRAQLRATASGLYESRWLSVRVPASHRSMLLRPLSGTVIPCWVQGARLGFAFDAAVSASAFEQRGQTPAIFHGARADEWCAARHYPRNPSGDACAAAGLCSFNGRHLGTLFDPSASRLAQQWQHVPQNLSGLRTSPWALVFRQAYAWCAAYGSEST
ncbi:tegument protein/v-FGAM-synthetase [Eptesicus fuscus gammaherpesvirus]|uniref:Tegument protein/v-FGAM-synthetase n=1 Tax=vespertilionid gammaherpesvirus 3 TaxID=2846598 RepID=A0A2D1A5R6_9GAMA|nr:tegument protein/v-FGAM-synthetase [Eptesicus fuscus gammaherpesvirus]ATA58304.1 tegument protein/v-FGAM-synthetase [Eptesicus fuscus gammaherpesvirus]WAH70887.1 FGAM synthase [Eptesicus fuscus gammaherpesvirus]